MESTTKERILDEALVCFAENGYEGTLLRSIAAGLGLSKSALYKHYKSKEEIWDAMIDRMEAYYAGRFGSPEHLPPIPETWGSFRSLVAQMVDFTIHDERIIRTRKLILTGQFRDERLNGLATRHFLTGTRALFRAVFEKMMENGLLKRDDPEMTALAFTAPITSLIHWCDREPEREPEIMRQIEAFTAHFIKTYGKEA